MATAARPSCEAARELDAAAVLQLYRLCMTYLDQEGKHLRTTRQVLRLVYAAAVASKPQHLAELLERQQKVAEATAARHQERLHFQVVAGLLLGLAADKVSLREIAGVLPAGIARQVLAGREELHALALEVDKLTRDIALFGHYFVDFLRRFFVQLTGGRNPGCYGPAGLRREPVCGSLLQAQG